MNKHFPNKSLSDHLKFPLHHYNDRLGMNLQPRREYSGHVNPSNALQSTYHTLGPVQKVPAPSDKDLSHPSDHLCLSNLEGTRIQPNASLQNVTEPSDCKKR